MPERGLTLADLGDRHVIYADCRLCSRSVKLNTAQLSRQYGDDFTIVALRYWKCACCGSSYAMRNDRNYGCAGYVRGLDCTQRRVLSRRKAEAELLAGIKAKLTAPAYIKYMSAAVRAKLRQCEQGTNKKHLVAEIAKTERELQNAVDALVSLGKSTAVLARVRELETRKATLESQTRAIDKPLRIVPNIERMIVPGSAA